MENLKKNPMKFNISNGIGDADGEGTYFVDDAGNYYYQATSDSEPVLTDVPDGDFVAADSVVSMVTIATIPIENQNGRQKPRKVLKSSTRMEDKSDAYANTQNDDLDRNSASEIEDVKEYDINERDDCTPVFNGGMECGEQMTCTFCSYSTNKRYLLSRHLKSHSEDRPFKCSVCERGFKTYTSLQNHVNTHTGKKPHVCKHCKHCFTTSGELVRHIRYKHTHEKPHKCPDCEYASVELSKLRRHIRCHTGERPYQCPHCTYASPDTFKLKRHLRIHTGEKPYECEVCHARFTQSNSLKAHKLIHSVGDKPVFNCELCPTTCGRKTDLRIHMQKLHSSDKPLRCKRCNAEFPDRYTYKIHAKTHEGEKCFQCVICAYASISARHLESHMLIHSDQKPYMCEHCDQSFRQKQLLRRHVNLYHNPDYIPPEPKEKRHLCPTCNKSFRHKGNLIRHMASHDQSMEKNFKSDKRMKLFNGKLVEMFAEKWDEIESESNDIEKKKIDNEIENVESNEAISEDVTEQEYEDEKPEILDMDDIEHVSYENEHRHFEKIESLSSSVVEHDSQVYIIPNNVNITDHTKIENVIPNCFGFDIEDGSEDDNIENLTFAND